ncbi:MAG: hypothetical protein GXZ09_06795 [Syntrophomonadaceae bacterium]|nr:hypothetical protein [Syntrophomonadaceae bacterium]
MVALRLLWIHVFAWFTVWLFSYWAGMEYIAAVLYLIIISREALSLQGCQLGQRIMAALLWQLPAYLMTVILLTGWNPGQIYNYAIFILSFWMTPLLPWLSLFKSSSLAYPAYYYGLLISAPILSIWVWLFSSTINPLAAYKHRFGVTKDCV